MERVVPRLLLVVLLLWTQSLLGQTSRIKDLVNIRGYRDNQIIGFGLIIGLAGTGDSSKSMATNNAMANMMTRLGMHTDAGEASSQSVAAVVATAVLPAFKRNGDRIDIKVSTIGDAQSLAGGTLLMTPLKAGDGKVYVVGQGSVVVGQANGSGASVLTTALIPNGGVIEREFRPNIAPSGKMILSMRHADFTTNSRISDQINLFFKGFYAKSLDPSSIEVEIPPLYRNRVTEFVADLELLTVDVDQKAVVVINERTGTVVMGGGVKISKVSISHGDLSIRVSEQGKEGAGPKSVVNVAGTTIGDLVESMNALGVKPPDLVGILQAVHAAGALQAELKFL